MRIVVFLAMVLLIAGPLNWMTIRTLRLLHPRSRRFVTVAAVVGNLFWLFLPLVFSQRTSDALRLLRAVLAPPWLYWVLFTLLYTAFVMVIGLVWLPFIRRVRFATFARVPSFILIILLGVATVIGYFQAIVPLRVERVEVPIASLPPQFDGYRIVEMGDLHVGLFTRDSRLRKIAATVDSLRPDAVTVCGDLIDDDPYYVPKLLNGMRISTETPLYAVLGNHEIYGDPLSVVRQLHGSRIRMLVNEGVPIERNGAVLWLAGISDFAAEQQIREGIPKPDIDASLRGRPPDAMAVLLSHQPKAIDIARGKPVRLILAAHTHGGQFGWRVLGWSLAGVFLPYHMGLYRIGDQYMYVNTGTGYWVLPFRLGMSPEITLITLRRGSGNVAGIERRDRQTN